MCSSCYLSQNKKVRVYLVSRTVRGKTVKVVVRVVLRYHRQTYHVSSGWSSLIFQFRTFGRRSSSLRLAETLNRARWLLVPYNSIVTPQFHCSIPARNDDAITSAYVVWVYRPPAVYWQSTPELAFASIVVQYTASDIYAQTTYALVYIALRIYKRIM